MYVCLLNFEDFTHSEAVDQPPYDHLRQLKARDLQHGSNEVASHADEYCPPSAESVTKREREETADEGTQLRHVSTGEDRVRGTASRTEKQLAVMPLTLGSSTSGKCFSKSSDIRTPP